MKKRFPSFLAGFLSAILLIALSAAAYAADAWTKTIEVGTINVLVNGKEFKPTDPNGKPVDIFVYNGTTYAPLRALAEAYGLTVGYDQERNLATVTSPGVQTSPSQTSTKPTSISLNHQYIYIGDGETVDLKIETIPQNSTATISWATSNPEYFKVVDGRVTVIKSGGGSCTVTAKTDNGLTANCYVMMKTSDVTTKKIGDNLVYSLFPNILSFENVSPDTPLWTHYELDLNKFGMYEHSYSYLVNTPEKATELARSYAYWLRSQGYTLVREEDDPVVKQPAGYDDTIYELRDSSKGYSIEIKGDIWGPGGPTVHVGIDYSATVSKQPTTPDGPTTLISAPDQEGPFGFGYGVNSVNGIKLRWKAYNQTGKTIYYCILRLNFYNSVGDPAYDQITGLPYKDIKLVGPCKPGGEIVIHDIIGYVPACTKIQIGDMKLEYSDGTEDSFWYGYYTKNHNRWLDD